MKKILSLLCLSSSLFSMQLQVVPHQKEYRDVHLYKSSEKQNLAKLMVCPESVFVPNVLGSVDLSHGKKGFSVYKDGQKHLIKQYHTDKILRSLNQKQLEAFLQVGYLCLNKMSNGEYILKANARINGGGPVLGAVMYWITKSTCYAVAATATAFTAGGAVAAVVATGGAAAPALVGVTSVAGAVATSTVAAAGTAIGTGAVITTTAGVVAATAATGGSVAVAAGLAGTGAAAMTAVAGGTAIGTTAVTTTVAVVSSAGGIGATIAGIEAASVAVGTFFGMLPTP